MTKDIYVVYSVENGDIDTIEVFQEYLDAKNFVKDQKKKGKDLNIWQRPLR